MGKTAEILLSFEPNYESIVRLKEAAVAEYGANWQPNLNRAITAMEPNARRPYLYKLKQAFAYDRAVMVWRRAEGILKGAVPSSAAGGFEVFEEALPRFGAAGLKLLGDLKEKLGIKAPALRVTPAMAAAPAAKAEDKARKPILEPERPDRPIKVKKSTLARKRASAAAIARVSSAKREEAAAPAVFAAEEPPSYVATRGSLFERLEQFVSDSREVMAMLVVNGNYSSIEEYPHYGFITDVTNALIKIAEKDPRLKAKAAFYRDSLNGEVVMATAAEGSNVPSSKKKKKGLK